MQTFELFKIVQSQALSTPKAFHFEGAEKVVVRNQSNAVIITPFYYGT